MASRSTPPLNAPLLTGKNVNARERVTSFLEEHLRASGTRVGGRLPTSRAIAGHLEVSVTTVQNVFRQLAAEGFIRTEVGNGSFLAAELPTAARPEHLRIGLSFGMATAGEPQGEWSSAISGAILRAAALRAAPVSICPVFIPDPAHAFDILKEQEGSVDGMILHPVPEGGRLARREKKLGYPVIHLNPGHASASANFVSADFYGISHQLGKAWAAAKRERVLFVHNSGEEMNASAALRCAGLVAGLGNRVGNPVSLQIASGDEPSHEAGYDLARKLLRRAAKLPDAVYLVGDELALGFCQFFEERGGDIPGEVSVVGGSGAAQLTGPYRDLTRTSQPTDAIGTALFEMACQLALAAGGAEVPGRFVPCTFTGGATTSPTENERLFPAPSRKK